MFISLKDILKNEMFQEVEILAGKDSLEKNVKRVSVFDCPCRENLIERDILQEGDVFISCLDQFEHDRENINAFISALIRTKSAGIIVVTDDMREVLTEKILERCDKNGLPVILMADEVPYAAIIDTINKYIAIDNFNALNMLKIEKIMYGNISQAERMETLYSINPNIEPYIRVISIDGDFNSDIGALELHMYYLNRRTDIYVRNGQHMIFVLSEENEKALRRHSDATAVRFSEFIDSPTVGYSRIQNRKDIAKALEEAKRALETAKTMNISSQTYEPLSVLQLLLSVKDSQEAYDFYHKYVEAVQARVSAENLQETLRTMEAYVANSGNYQATAKAMNQHENTIRYRVNKVKAALDMEDDNLRFHETIAVAVKLRTLLHESL